MVTERELERLKREVETQWSNEWKNNLAFNADDILAIITKNVKRYQVGFKMEFVDIELEVFAKASTSLTEKGNVPTIINVTAEFTKNFSETSYGDWCISKFNVTDIKKYN